MVRLSPWAMRPKVGVWVAKARSCDLGGLIFFYREPPPPPPPELWYWEEAGSQKLRQFLWSCLFSAPCINRMEKAHQFTTEIWTHICSCHNFPPSPPPPPPFFCADTFITSLLLIVCALRWYVKSLYRHLFLVDISKHARVTQKMATRLIPRRRELPPPNLCCGLLIP